MYYMQRKQKWFKWSEGRNKCPARHFSYSIQQNFTENLFLVVLTLIFKKIPFFSIALLPSPQNKGLAQPMRVATSYIKR